MVDYATIVIKHCHFRTKLEPYHQLDLVPCSLDVTLPRPIEGEHLLPQYNREHIDMTSGHCYSVLEEEVSNV